MNIFAVDKNPAIAARCSMNRHTVKMVTETRQMLDANYHLLGGKPYPGQYKVTHVNHPSTIWARTSYENYMWLLEYFVYISEEYTYRYGRTHKSRLTAEPILHNKLKPSQFEHFHITPITPAMPDDIKKYPNPDNMKEAVINYRRLYVHGKSHLGFWKKRLPPSWYIDFFTAQGLELVSVKDVYFLG